LFNRISNNSSSNSNSSISVSSNNGNHLDRKRKRTSIAVPEKRSLEAFFSVQPRPSGEKIAQIADKLDLKKNVVRVWFCNQRQKQKRMKFAAIP
jgi:POU domain transcription factor, class 4